MDLDTLIVAVLLPGTFVAMMVAERLWPAREFPPVSGWAWVAGAVYVYGMATAVTLGVLLPEDWLHAHRLMNLEGLGIVGGTVLGYAAYSFVDYWLHRAQHRYTFLWRFHQTHHSVPRLDIPGVWVSHPIDGIVHFAVPTVVCVFVLGLDGTAAVLVGFLKALSTLTPHWNVRTPAWLGWIFNRPELHLWHHQRGLHAHNYGNWPLWDRLFGTYREPVDHGEPVEIGFDCGAGLRPQLKMLALIDVNAANTANAGRGRQEAA